MQLRTQFLQHLHPLGLHAVLHLVFSLCSWSSGATGVWKYMYERWFYNVLEEVVCLHEQLVSLSRESHDDIDSEEYLRTSRDFSFLSDLLNLMGKRSGVVAASHLSQDGVAS